MKGMSPEELNARAELAKRLDEWGRTYDGRDALIREARASGISKAEIARRMRLSRTTVVTVVGPDDDESED